MVHNLIIISPLLFALFINDLSDKIKTNCLLFADDVKLYNKIGSQLDAQLLQEDLTYLAAWSDLWKLKLNPAKCKSFTMSLKRNPITVRYNIQDSTLEKVDTTRDLGVWLDTKLSFAEHINNTVSKANRALGAMIRSFQTGHTAGRARRNLKPEPILAAYFGNIRSVMEFGCVIWGGCCQDTLR